MTPPKILFIGGTHPRHLYYANQIHIRYPLAGAILQQRNDMIQSPPLGFTAEDGRLWIHHFMHRKNTEVRYLGRGRFPPVKYKIIPTGVIPHSLAKDEPIEFVKEINPDIALIFGCGMIRGELAEALPELTINLHLGLSPRYRGAATLFWPFYFLEPQWAGCTFHKIVNEPDAGDILHQCVPELAKGNGIHDVAAKAVVEATEDMITMLDRMTIEGFEWRFQQQSTTGKNFLARDFQPSHLRMIYETYNDDIVDQYLDGNLKQHKPKLVRQF